MGKTVTQIIAEHRGGLIARTLDEALHEAIESAQDTGQKAEITIKLRLTPHGKNNREMHLRITHTSKLPPPSEQQDESIWFGVRGQLQRDDPDQVEMFGPKGVAAEELPSRKTG